MRFTLPEDIFETAPQQPADEDQYFGLPRNVVENEHIPLPPGLSRVRTIRKIHLELGMVKDRLQKWDSVQAELTTTLGVLRKTICELERPDKTSPMALQLKRDSSYLQNQVHHLTLASKELDPRSGDQNLPYEGYIEMPKHALHYLAVYDDNPWEH